MSGERAPLAKMPAWHARAIALAEVLSSVFGVRILPQPPQVNMFHIHLAASPDALAAARDALAEREGAWIGRFAPGATPDTAYMELYVGDAMLGVDDARIAALFGQLMAGARATP